MVSLSGSVTAGRVFLIPVFLFLWLLVTACSAPDTVGAAPAGLPHSAADFANPLIKQRADPWVLRHSDGYYYFIATVPEYDRLVLRRAHTLAELTSASEQVIWRKHNSGPMSANIWAPELHYVEGRWVIYFAAGEQARPWHIRMYAISTDAANPLTGQWQEHEQIKTPWDSFSLDATSFTHQGKRYLLWAQADEAGSYNSALLLAEMASPTEIKLPVAVISEPTLPWEIIGYKVNEGASVIEHDGRILVTYSASATDHNYAMGLLWADAESDLLDTANWHKSPDPVFFTNEAVQRFGPGHSCFTQTEDGQDVLVYHARSYKEIQGNPLADGNRHTRVRYFHWDENGFPDFGQNQPD